MKIVASAVPPPPFRHSLRATTLNSIYCFICILPDIPAQMIILTLCV